jgi:Phosphotransferase enzyme family
VTEDRPSAPTLAQIQAVIEDAVRAQIVEYGRLRAVNLAQSNYRAYSKVHRFVLDFERGSLDVCLKLHQRTSSSEAREWAQEEFSVLGALYAASAVRRKTTELSVVRPLLFLPQLPGIVLETHHGAVLNDVLKARRLRWWSRSIRQLEEHFEKLGISLREFQRLTVSDPEVVEVLNGLSPIDYSPNDFADEADRRFQGAMSLAGNENGASTQRLHEVSRRCFLEKVRDDYPRVGGHGDFTPVNVFVLGSRVTLFDFVNFNLGHPFEDVGRFISYTYFLRKDPLSMARRDVSRLVEAFMHGYGLAGWRSDPILRFFFQKSMYRTLEGGLRFLKKPWPAVTIYRRAMLLTFSRWVEEGMGLPV